MLYNIINSSIFLERTTDIKNPLPHDDEALRIYVNQNKSIF